MQGKRVNISKIGDERHFAQPEPGKCDVSGEVQSQLLAPVFDYLQRHLLDAHSPTKFLLVDSGSESYHKIMFSREEQTVMFDPRSEQGLLVVNIINETFDYCVRVKENDQSIDIVIELIDFLAA